MEKGTCFYCGRDDSDFVDLEGFPLCEDCAEPWERTTEDVREIYLQDILPGSVEDEAKKFDRWLQRIKDDAWREGYNAVVTNAHVDWVVTELPDSPYGHACEDCDD